MFDGPNAFPVRHGELQRVLARRQARADVVLKRRGHAVHHRRQPHVATKAFDHSSLRIDDGVPERHDLRRRVVGADGGMHEQLNLRGIWAAKGEGRHLQRQRRGHHRRDESARHGLAWAARVVEIASRHDLPSRTHARARAFRRHADRMGLAILVGCARFDAEQVVTRQLRLDSGERAVGRHGDVEQGSARRVGQRLHTDARFAAVVEPRDRGALLGDVREHRLLEFERVDARARGGSERAQILDVDQAVADNESFGHQDEGLRRVNRSDGIDERAERRDRHVAIRRALHSHRVRFVFDDRFAQLAARARRLAFAFAVDDALEHTRFVVVDRERLGERHGVATRAARREPQAYHPRDRFLQAPAIGGKRRRRRAARSEADHGDAVGRLQMIDEPVDGAPDGDSAAESDVRLIDDEHDQPAPRRMFVGRIAGRKRRRIRSGRRHERNPFGAHDAPRPAVDLDDEVLGPQIGHRAALSVHDTHVDRGELDARLEDRRLSRRLGGERRCRQQP